MKWYSHKTYTLHMSDMKDFKDDNLMRQAYQDWPKVLSNRFDKSYPRVGILDQLDLLQEGYVGFYKAWDKLNWELVGKRPEEERVGMITNYLKSAIKRHIIRAIARDRDTIRIPEGYYLENPMGYTDKGQKYNINQQTDIFLTRTFSSFFDESVLEWADETDKYITDQLNDLLNDYMNRLLNPIQKVVIKMFYGIDEAMDKPRAQARIAEECSTSISNVQNIKHRAIKKLKDNKELIENNYRNIVMN